MIDVLNSPLEVGIRILVLLDAVAPGELDMDAICLMDHYLLHSGDFGGPRSLMPDLPLRASEIGVKRSLVESGISLMAQAAKITPVAKVEGLLYRGHPEVSPFLDLFQSEHLIELRERSKWVSSYFRDRTREEIERMYLELWGRRESSSLRMEGLVE